MNESFVGCLGHMNKLAATPMYDKKNFNNLLLQNQKACDLETWYVALGPQTHHSANNDLTLFLTAYFTVR